MLATKFGNLGARGGGKIADGRPEFVISSCEASLKRLGVDVIDLYYQHRIDPTVPVEDTVGAMSRLVEQGKVRALGLSEAHPETIRRAHAVHAIAAVQNEYSLLYRAEAEETLQTTRQLNIGFVAYAPLGRGLLTGAVAGQEGLAEDDGRRRHPRFAPENLAQNLTLVHRIEEMSLRKKCTPGQLALAWVLAQGEDIVPIPGTKRRERLLENIGALSVELTDEDLVQISDAVPVGAAAGSRYPARRPRSARGLRRSARRKARQIIQRGVLFRLVPGIGMMSSPCASTQASASWPGVHCLRLGQCLRCGGPARHCGRGFPARTAGGGGGRRLRRYPPELLDLARQQAAAERGVGDEGDIERARGFEVSSASVR